MVPKGRDARKMFIFFIAFVSIVVVLSRLVKSTTRIEKTCNETIQEFPSTAPSPLFQVIPQFMSSDECMELINIAKPSLQDAMVGIDKPTKSAEIRNNKVCFIPGNKTELTRRIYERASSMLNVPSSHFEQIQVGQYGTGEYYKIHSDDALEFHENPRSHTLLIYLNTVNKGGETYFNRLGIRAQPIQGNAVLFRPVLPTETGYKSLEETLHEALVVEEGEKWIATIWVHFKKWN